MSTASNGRVASDQRYRRDRPCPICGGSDTKGAESRCYGFASDGGDYAHCTRADRAGGLPMKPGSNTFAHRLKGPCKCGVEHGPAEHKPAPMRPPPKARVVTTYVYHDEGGRPLFRVKRMSDRRFFQEQAGAVRGTWTNGIDGVRRVLYRLPELLAADPDSPVFIVEGEKDANNLRDVGLVATCNPMGAGKWLPEYSPHLAGRVACVIADNDDVGRKHAREVAASLAGVAAEVKCLDLAGACRSLGLGELPAKGDASDFLAMGGTAEALVAVFSAAANWSPDLEPIADDDGPAVADRWPVLDDAAYHGILGEIVRASGPHTEADPVAVLVQLLAGFGNAIGRGPHWVAGADRHHAVLFAALVGPTASGRKGMSWSVARHFLSQLDPDWAAGRLTSGLTSGEGLIYHVRDRVTKLDDDGNDVVVDEGVSDKRLMAIETEFGRTLRVMARESNTLSAVIRQAWDCGERLSTLTKNSTNHASNPHVSIVGHITAEELEAMLKGTDTANGFGNRFLWLCVRRSKELPDGGDFYGVDWGPIHDRLRAAFDAARSICRMARDGESAAIWKGVYPDLTAPKPGLLGSMLARGESQVMRIACLYALLDGSSSIRPPHMEAALAVWQYAEASARFIFGESLGDARAEKLLDALKSRPAGMKRSEISVEVFGRNLDAAKLGAMLERMLGLGLIHRVESQGGVGRRAELWFAGRVARAPTK